MKWLWGLILILCLCGATLAFKDANIEQARWTKEADRLARLTEAKYNLPHGLARATSWRESKHIASGPQSQRVEFHYFNVGNTYHKQILNNASKWVTLNLHRLPYDSLTGITLERLQRATSFTRFQLMGENMRAYGFNGIHLAAITDSEAFDLWGRFMRDHLDRYNGNLAHSLAAYNGGHGKINIWKKTGRYGKSDGYVREVMANTKRFAY